MATETVPSIHTSGNSAVPPTTPTEAHADYISSEAEADYIEQAEAHLLEFSLIPVMTMEEYMASLPKPPTPSIAKQIKKKFYVTRDQYYARKLDGTTGTLACGVRWWLRRPEPDNPHNCFGARGLMLDYSDPRTKGILASGYYFVDCAHEEQYLSSLKEHVRMLSIRQLEPATPDDPDGFFVRWQKDKGFSHE